MEILHGAFIYLVAAVVAVPIAKRLGMGSVLGYLISGIVIGPVLGLVGSETEQVKHFAEFGVVMMLFLVGLELQPSHLWRMKAQLIGLGGLQVGLTMLAVTVVALLLGLVWQSALAIGMIFALSSTAIVLQTLNEKSWMAGTAGQSTFSVLLFQDIAVIPMLSLLPLLSVYQSSGGNHGHASGLESYPGWLQSLVILAVIFAIAIIGRYLIRHAFRFIAASRLREIFTATALLIVIAITLVMEFVGLSPALGTFLAGVVLSDSEYRHELESDIAPFKGLLLGLFFISVGAGINFGLLTDKLGLIIGLALAIMLAKFIILYLLGSLFGLRLADRWLFALGLAQTGEFAFVLFNYSLSNGVLPADLIAMLNLVVTITMLLTPLLFIFYEMFIEDYFSSEEQREADLIEEQGTAIVAGVGRFGQMISRLLLTNGHKVVLLDHDAGIVELLRKVNLKTFYGDATRADLLEAAGIHDAKLFVAALDDQEKQNALVQFVIKNYPNCKVIARARNRPHLYELKKAGAHHVEREMFESSLSAGKVALQYLGAHPFRAEMQLRSFRKHDYEMIDAVAVKWYENGFSKDYLAEVRNKQEELYEIMKVDRHDRHDRSERGWNPPPSGDADA